MKKTLILFGIITLFLNSCGSKAVNLDVDDLEEPCDFVEALVDNYKAQINLYEDNEDESVDEWSKKDQKKLKKLKKLISKIRKQGEKVIDDDYDGKKSDFVDEFEDCDDFDDIEELEEELSDLKNNSGSSNESLCDCLMSANSEREALDCKPGSNREDLMKIFEECMERERKEYDHDEGASHYESCGGSVEEAVPAACGGCGEATNAEPAADHGCGGCGYDEDADADGCGGEDAATDEGCGGCGKDW